MSNYCHWKKIQKTTNFLQMVVENYFHLFLVRSLQQNILPKISLCKGWEKREMKRDQREIITIEVSIGSKTYSWLGVKLHALWKVTVTANLTMAERKIVPTKIFSRISGDSHLKMMYLKSHTFIYPSLTGIIKN